MASIHDLSARDQIDLFLSQSQDYGLIITDAEGIITHWSLGAEHITGWTREEVINQHASLIFTQEDRAADIPKAEMDTASTAHKASDIRWHIRKDGTRFFTDSVINSIRNADGEVIGFGKILRDITDRKRNSDHVERQAILLDSSYDAAFSWSLTTHQILYWNQGAQEVYGYSLNEVLGRRPQGLLKTVFPRGLEEVIDSLERTGRWQGLLCHTTKDGRMIYVESRMALRTDVDEFPIVLENNRDVTAQRCAEQELREREERYRTLFNSIGQGFYIVEMIFDDAGEAIDYRFLEANPAAERMNGLVGVVGKTVLELVPSARIDWIKTYGRVANTGEPAHFIDYSAALTRWFDVSVTRLRGNSSKQVALLFTDITESKENEEQLKRLAADLVDVNRRQSEFLATLAHELRNPLAPIRTGLDLIQAGSEVPPAVEKVHQMINRQVDHLVRLVDDLLDLARVSSGKIELKRSRQLLKDIVQSAVEISLPAIQARQHSFVIDIPEKPVWLNADAHRLRQVISNLLNNAARYTSEGGRISLALQLVNEEALIKVADNGIGIGSDDLPRIFEMFSQVGHVSQHGQGGARHRLASRQAANRKAWRYGFRSQWGPGTRQHFCDSSSS